MELGLGDKETVAICIQASVTCYLHVIHRYTRMVYRPWENFGVGKNWRIWRIANILPANNFFSEIQNYFSN